MDRLQDQYGDGVEFVHLNVDNASARETLQELGVRGRSQYLIVSADGDILHQWTGPIGHLEETIASELSKVAVTP